MGAKTDSLLWNRKRKKCFYCSPGPAKTYAKCKQCLSLPLSLVTRANYCAVFIRVEMICANKERRPSSTLCCVFSSQNCKWMQPPHLVPAGSVPVPPISALLTVGNQQKTESANSLGWCLINTFSPLTAPPHILLPGRVASNQGQNNVEMLGKHSHLCKDWHTVLFKSQFWLSLAVLRLLCNIKRCIFVHTGTDPCWRRQVFSMNISRKANKFRLNSRLNVKDQKTRGSNTLRCSAQQVNGPYLQ